jgi:hypothetical protein
MLLSFPLDAATQAMTETADAVAYPMAGVAERRTAVAQRH